jgi:hypothetical protein
MLERTFFLSYTPAVAAKVGILEFKDNDFITSVTRCLHDIPVEFIRLGELSHPSPSPYRVVIDRVSFADPFLREVMRYWSLTGTYVINNPFFTLNADKLSDVLCYDRLGIPHPRTMLLPRVNLIEDVREMVAEPDWGRITAAFRFPCILKPVDGYAWQDVVRADTVEELKSLYEDLKGRRLLILQELLDWSEYYRAFCVSRSEVLLMKWNPKPFDMGEYACVQTDGIGDVSGFITRKTIELNAFIGLDFNSVEWCVTRDGKPYIIDSYNDVPDVRKEKIPSPCYEWIVERFCACVRTKLASRETNGPITIECPGDPSPTPGA